MLGTCDIFSVDNNVTDHRNPGYQVVLETTSAQTSQPEWIGQTLPLLLPYNYSTNSVPSLRWSDDPSHMLWSNNSETLDRGDAGIQNSIQKVQSTASPLIAAALEGQTAVVRMLLKAGAKLLEPCDIRTSSIGFQSAIQAAAYGGSAQTMRVLLKAYMESNAEPEELASALKTAASRGHNDVVQLLLDAGVDANGNQKESSSMNDGHFKDNPKLSPCKEARSGLSSSSRSRITKNKPPTKAKKLTPQVRAKSSGSKDSLERNKSRVTLTEQGNFMQSTTETSQFDAVHSSSVSKLISGSQLTSTLAADTLVLAVEDTTSKSESKSERKRGRRNGPLNENSRSGAQSMRDCGACRTCQFSKAKVRNTLYHFKD